MTLSITQAVTRAIHTGNDERWSESYYLENGPNFDGFFFDGLYWREKEYNDVKVMNDCLYFGTLDGMALHNLI